MQYLNMLGTTVTCIRLKHSAFSPISDHVYSVNRKRTRNPPLDSFLGAVLRLFESYADTYLPEKQLRFKSEDCLAEAWDPADPLFILVIAESALGPVDDTDIEELRHVLAAFASSILERMGEDMFSPPSAKLTSQQREFVQDAAIDYLRLHKGQTITAPFECTFPEANFPPLPIQGKVRPAPRATLDTSEEAFLAISDGVKADDLSIFLREINDKGEPKKDITDTYTAEQESLLRVAAEAYLAPIKTVEVTVCKKLDLKGTARRYVKNIRPVSANEFQTKLSESQLQL